MATTATCGLRQRACSGALFIHRGLHDRLRDYRCAHPAEQRRALALFSGTVDSTGDASYSTPQPIVLAAGDTIDFAVGFGINGHSSDSTRLEASITLIDDCPADISPQPVGDDAVDVNDLLAVITTWGACPPQRQPIAPAISTTTKP